ncbi:hypothetical protein M1N66_02360 [Thermodesulfovibrionales bacterium]|nr:hypothetical protein [Thermodesulfovibrionales bacterium]MCL0086638.1 hypothetical protein [Thermodesulfovibrionales bacterium]MCL0096433.1 hypothetical protein [Thermodesulfovibrionales bacterium]
MTAITNIGFIDRGATAELESLRSADPTTIAKKVETIFLSKFLKIMLEQTHFSKDKTISTYMQFVVQEMSESLSKRGIGIGEFFLDSIKRSIDKPDKSGVADRPPIKEVGRDKKSAPEQLPAAYYPSLEFSLPLKSRIIA